VSQRIAELDASLVDKRRLRDQLAAHAPAPAPTLADVEGLLQKLPLIAERLPELPTAERPLPADQLPMPAQKPIGPHYEGSPETFRETEASCGQQQLIGLPELRPLHLPAENLQLMTKHEYLQF
jgi:hypothetical protein